MTDLETIERLCSVVCSLNDLVKAQATFIEEHISVENEASKNFAQRRDDLDTEISKINGNLYL